MVARQTVFAFTYRYRVNLFKNFNKEHLRATSLVGKTNFDPEYRESIKDEQFQTSRWVTVTYHNKTIPSFVELQSDKLILFLFTFRSTHLSTAFQKTLARR